MAPHIGTRILALRFIRGIILTPTVIGLAIYYLASRFSLPYRPLLVVCGVVVGWPIKFSLRVRYEGWCRARRARTFAAVPALESRGRLFGDIDALHGVQEADKSGFVGEFSRLVRKPRIALVEHNSPCLVGEWFGAQHEKAGSGTFAAVFIGEYFLSTSDPGNIKVVLATEFNNFEKGTSDHSSKRHPLIVLLIRFLQP